MSPTELEKASGFKGTGFTWQLQKKRPHAGESVRKENGYVIACNSLKRKISQVDVVEGFESRPHKAVSFVIE